MRLGGRIRHLKNRIKLNKRAFIAYSILRALIIVTAIRCFIMGNYESFNLCILSLVLFLVPGFLEETLKIDFPPLFEIIIYLFIYAAEILGEVNKYYTAIPGWDTMLHTLNGFLCAAIGFSLVEVSNRRSKRLQLSPVYLALVAFCFSMTVGVLWEFVEYTCDHFFFWDMQKDTIVSAIGSVTLDPTHSQNAIKVSDIAQTVIVTKNGQNYVVSGGYLDIGLNDTMKDLIVNFIGAVTFSVIGYMYEKTKDASSRIGQIATGLKVEALTDEEMEIQNLRIEAMQAEKKLRRSKLRRGKRK